MLLAHADTTPPVLAVPADIHYQQKRAGAIVRMTYTVPVVDDTDPHPRLRCTPRSGSRFPIGTTTVRCTATDASGNRATGSFRIVVKAAPARRSHRR
jgi:X-Pro dipeptidyl-peptidase